MADTYLSSDNEGIFVNTLLDPDTNERYILETYKNCQKRLSPNEARTRATTIYRAAGVAESSAGLIKLLTFDKGKGFKSKPQMEKAAHHAAKTISVMMQDLEPFPDDIHVGFGFRFEKAEVVPTLTLTWGDTNVSLHIEDARSHAAVLMGSAEAVETDAFITSFFTVQGITIDEIQVFLQRFAEYRLAQLEPKAPA